mgnify:CR=1 FL=1
MIKTPEFWNHRGIMSISLWPLSLIWAFASAMRNHFARQITAALPVICIGNVTAGGTGKTPVTAFLYDELCDAGYRPAILIRGYRAAVKTPLWVDPSQHTVDNCGDEALMLAESRDVLVAQDRVAGAHVISVRGIHDVILMDDGMQNPFICKTLSIGIFDGSIGIGNGFLIPAGPLRVSLASGVKQMDIALINGNDETNIAAKLPPSLTRFSARILPDQTIIDALGDTPILAFAGIGQPKRFFATLRKAGCNLVDYLAFADHHIYSETDLVRLQEDSMRLGAQLVTTQKDWVRLPAEWRERIVVFPVTLAIDDDGALRTGVEAAISAHQTS